ncbi:MAG: twin-arginine translocation pathway signal protein [Proteobacteria bacterium]|nr:twin-arginine translocation pathway signal protein [Pseudomonadota bacterium]
MNRRTFIRTIGGTGIVLAASGVGLASCDQMPKSAVAAWEGPDNGLPDREWMLSYAMLAPNPHNMQPWLVDLTTEGEITLYVDPERLLPETDPYGRQILIGQGTFLELLNIAAHEKGYQTKISLFPEGEPKSGSLEIAGKPVAQIKLEKGAEPSKDPLFRQIPHRRSNKEGYEEQYLAQTDRDALAGLRLNEGERTGFATAAEDVAPLREFARKAILMEMETPRTLLESIERTRIGADEIAKNPDGIDLNGPLFWWLKRFGLMTPEEAMTPGTMAYQGGIDYAMGWVEGTHNMGWLVTKGNSRSAQVQAGRTYVRLNLMATAQNIAMHPVSQVLQEYPEMADIQSEFNSHLGIGPDETVQMFFRLGYQKAVSPSPRRKLPDIIMG